MAIAVFIPVILWAGADEFVQAYLVGTAILVLFGFVDDMKGLGYKAKFIGQILAALVIIFYGGVRISSLGSLLPGDMHLPGWLAVFLTLIAIVGVTNAINLADGLDGLAGGISLLSFCCIGYLAYLGGSASIILITMAVAGAIFGFLRFNTYPASLFMGDTGSQLLGFSAVVLAVKITQGDIPLSPILPLIILGFPILDTLNVMAQRISRGKSPFSPDKNHFHHRLIGFGLSHAEAVFVIYVIQSMMILSAIFFKYQADWLIIAGYIGFSFVTIRSIYFNGPEKSPIPPPISNYRTCLQRQVEKNQGQKLAHQGFLQCIENNRTTTVYVLLSVARKGSSICFHHLLMLQSAYLSGHYHRKQYLADALGWPST